MAKRRENRLVRKERACEKPGCDVVFTPTGKGSHWRKYCDKHSAGPAKDRELVVGVRYCQLEGCRRQIPKDRPTQAKYCDDTHAYKAGNQRSRDKAAAKKEAQLRYDSPQVAPQTRDGETLRKLEGTPGILAMLLDGRMTATAYAADNNITTGAVTRAVHAAKVKQELAALQTDWRPSWRVQAMLPAYSMTVAKRMGMGGQAGTPEFESLIDELVRAYGVFSRYYFNLEGKRPLVEEFHERWIRSIIVAYATGGKQLILSPPRHGKSEMLIRFVVWFIVMDPNIRIGWFCASTDVAKLMLGAVKDILENNEVLIRDTLPPGQLYDPGLKSGKPWSAKEIKVAQQTHVGAKSSSMLALGRTSKFLSRDMDIIIIDDLEDYDSTREEGQRVYSKNKLAEIGTRKVEQTAEIYIGSRQHPDDIPNAILDLGDTILQWKVIVDSAHDENCGLEPDDPDMFHLHQDCMLFPEVRSYRYLMEKKLEMETLGLGHLYPLRYLNTAVPAEGQVFDMDLIRENALDRERGTGLDDLPLGRLAAGLDPSARGIQASFLWHYLDGKMSMVDIETDQSGGQEGAIRIIYHWYHEYGLTLWFYETNATQVDWYDNIKKHLATKRCPTCEEIHDDIILKDHNTGSNKKDPELGISSMAPRYHDGRISLPYGTVGARQKVNKLLRQLELWTTSGVIKRGRKTDIKMSSWFPFPYFLSLEKETKRPVLQESADSSYPATGFTETPWASMYPGR